RDPVRSARGRSREAEGVGRGGGGEHGGRRRPPVPPGLAGSGAPSSLPQPPPPRGGWGGRPGGPPPPARGALGAGRDLGGGAGGGGGGGGCLRGAPAVLRRGGPGRRGRSACVLDPSAVVAAVGNDGHGMPPARPFGTTPRSLEPFFSTPCRRITSRTMRSA